MRWIGNLLLLLLLHSLSESKAKRRKREAKDTVDPLLSLVFNTPEIKHESKIKDTRPDRAISPDEELAALLDAVGKQNYKHSRSNVQEKRSAVYPQTHLGGVPAESTVLDAMTRSSITGLSAQNTDSVGIGPTYSDSMNTFTRSLMPKPVLNGPQALNPNPQDMENAGLVPRTMPVPAAQPVPFQPMHVASVPDVQSQQTLPGIVAAPLVSFNPVPGSQALVNNTLAKKSDVAVPGSKPFNDQQDLTYFMPDDKKSSIPIPVRTESSEVVMNKDSEPIQLRVISPNMKLRGVVPHNPEYGETVESIAKADDMLRRSGIFRPVYLPKIIHPVKKSSIPRPKDMTKTKTDTDQRSTIPFLTQPLAPLSVPNGQPYSNYQQSPPLQYASAATYSNGKPTTVNTFSKPEYIQQFQLEQSGMHAKPKDIAADECADQYPGQCLEFAKNFYCTKFVDLMRIQCRKSCHFCNQEKEAPAGETVGKQEPVKEGVSSGSGSGSGGMASGSGEEDTEGYSSRMETNKSRKNQILYLPELGSGSGGSGSGTGESHAQHQQVKTNEKSQPKEAKKKAKVPDSVKAEAITITKTPSQNFQVPATKNKEEAVAKKSVNVGGNVTKKSVIPQVAIVHEYSKVMPVEAAGSDHEESSGSGSASGDGSGSGSSSGSGERETESAKATPTKVKATVTVKKKANFTKKATIPKAPQDFLKRLGNYPKIDLKVIAAALAKYEEAALQMAAEYPHYMESNVAEVERSSIPKPEIVGNVKVEKMKQDIQVAKLSMQEHSKRFEIPKYLIVGEDIHEKGGVAKQPSALEDAASFESVSARFRDAGRNPSLMEFYAETGKTGVEETGERRSRLSRRKKLKPVDPYEYLRNMAPGASMEPIVDPKARSSVPASHSYPLFLMKVAPGSDKYIEAPKTRSTVAAAKPVMHNPLLELQQHFVAPPPAHAVQPQATQANPAADFFAPKPAPVENPIMNGAPFSEQAAAIGSNPSEDQAQFTQIPQANVASVVSQTGVARGPPMQSPEIAAEPFRDFPFGNNFPSPQAAKNPLQTHDEDMTIMASAASLPVGAGNFEKQALALDTPAAAASLLQQTESNVGTMEQANPLSPLLNYLGSSSPDEPGVTRTLNLQNLLSKGAAIKLSLPEKTPVVPQGSSSTYLQTNLDALTPETAAVTSAANNGQSDLTANAIGARVTMSKTQETKWVRPNAEHELASIMPENGNLADVRSDLAAAFGTSIGAEPSPVSEETVRQELPTQAENGLIDQQFAALAGFQESRNEKPLIPQTPKVETSVQRDSLPQPALVSGPPAMAQTQNNGAAQVNTDVLVDSSMLRDAASAAAQATPSIGFVTKTDERSDSNLLPNAPPSQTPQGTANEINDVAAATFARKANVQIPQNVPSSPQLTTAQASPNANLAAMQDAPLQEVAQEDPLVLSSHDANPMTSAKVGIQTLQTPTDISPSPGVEENSFLPPLIYGGSESQPGMSSSSRGESLPPLNQAPNSATASFSTSQQDFKQSAPSTALIGNSMNPDVSNVAVHQKEASEELTSVKSDQALQQKSAFGNGSPLRGGHPFATPIVQDKRTQLNGKPLIINAFYQKKEVNPPASASPWMQFNIDNSDKQPLNSRDQVQQSLYGHNAYPLAAQETSKLEAYMSGAAYHYDPQQEMRSTTPGKPNLDHIQGPAQGQVQGGGLGQAQGPVQGGGQVQVQGGSQGQAQGQVQRGGQNQGQGQAQVQGQGLNQFQSSEAMAPIGMTSMGPTFEVGTPTEMKSQADAQTYKPVNALRSRTQLMPQIAQVPPEGTSRLVPEAESYNAPHKKNLIKHKPDLDCGEGWDGASGDFGTFCYKKMTVRTTFDDALSECRRLNSDLFSILNAYENRYLQDNINEKFWIGYRDRSMDGAWNWTDNSRSIYTNWGSEADDSTGQRRDCVLLDGDQGKWKDEPCSAVYPYLCKAKKGCPKNWNKLKLESTSGCYRLFKEKKSWEEAEQDCELHNGHLSSILSEEEQTMVFRVHSSKSFWIGYNDKDSEGDWTWSDRATSSYTNWDDRSPNNGGVSCAAMLEGGKWHDEPCSEKLPFICKRKGPKGEKLDGLDESGALKPVSRLMNNSATAPNFIFDEMAKTVSMPVVAVSFWPLLKSSRTGLSGSRPLAIHGAIAEVANGVALDGNASFLDAGDFNGKCVSDTEKCQKGFAIALQVIFDESVKNYKTPHCVVDTAGGGKGFTIYIKDNKLHYKVARSDFVWELATDLITSRWQEIVMSWHRDKGITVYVNGAFKDSISEGKSPGHFDPNALTRLLIGRQSNAKKPYYYTKMIVTSLTFFTKALTIEDVPYAFTFDDTVVANYRWLMPHLTNNLIPGSPAVKSFKEVTDIDGGILIDGDKGWLEVTDYDTCLQDPSNCNHGFALSFKLKFDQQIVREYKEAHYIMDSGGHKNGLKGISVYLVNDNLYFQVIMSPQEDIMIWTVRTPVYTVRWQRVVMTWRLDKGLWVYLDGSFRGLTKTPRTLPILAKEHLNRFVIGRKTVGPDYRGAVFGISSLAIYSRFLTRKDAEKVFGEKDNPFPGLIREVWKNIPGPSLQHLKSNPDYPNNPTNIEIIENFDAPFDVAKDYGSKLKGYFVSPETGNYTFYMSCSKSCELYFSSDEDVRNKTKILQLYKPTWHNQWNKYSNQSSKSIYMVAGKYYFLEAIQKGEENSDTLSVGVRMPSGRYQRPINKENLQWRLQGNPFAGVVREVWYDIPGYEVQDLQNDRNFPENPSSIEVLDKFDAPFNVDDNYGSRLSAFFRAPETGDYRFYLASDSTGELWISSDDSERNLVKVITLNGWTDHNEWLKYSDQKSNKIYLLAGKYYYIRAYQKADKLGDSVSVAVELPSGLFEGPIKRKRLSWKLPNGKTAPGPRDLIEPLPKPVGVYRLNDASLRDVITGDNGMIIHNVDMTPGPGGVKDSAFLFKGKRDSFIEIPNSGKLDTRNAITMLANVFPTGNDGPILNYRKDGWGVHLWQFDKSQLFVRFVTRSNEMTTQPLGTRVLQLNEWNQVGASYDNNTGVAQLWHDGKMVKSRNIGQVDLATQYPIRVGAREGDDRYFRGKISCIQLYDKALTERQIGEVRQCPRKDGQREDPLLALTQTGSGTELANEDSYSIENRVGEDTEEELAANKCDPNPCANSGKCVNDEKKVDGYHCQCTSDFAGKHCQVSKPAARNPNVKRMNIPNYPKKVGTEQYTRVSAKKSSGGPKTAEDERQDIFLLYQRLGCYRDDSNRRDLPRKVPLKAVSQEECVRACALQDKGYAYFGLQNGKDCYCSKKYGRYGKVEDNDCSLRCKDNMEQNCGGKERNLVFFFGLGTNYTIKTYTGKKFGAGTDAKVFVELIGERGSSDFRQLDNKIERFEPGSMDTETLMLPDLGKLKKLRVLHDNSGSAPSWFLDKISVTDEEGETYEFPCNDWLSETQSGGKLERDIDVKTKVPSKS